MGDLVSAMQAAIESTSILETVAVIFAVIYLALAIQRNLWCWAAAAVSTSLYLVIFIDVKLYAESMLQVFYLGMAGYGFLRWRAVELEELAPVIRWSYRSHIIALAAIALGTALLGAALALTDAAWPLVDAFTTTASLFATWMVARRVLENWLYWLIIDVISIALFIDRGLYFTAILFGLYIVMIAFGWRSWLTAYRAGSSA